MRPAGGQGQELRYRWHSSSQGHGNELQEGGASVV